ncbi:MAG: serine/threonine-protein kinase, partial [Planctomycetota bacterium]
VFEYIEGANVRDLVVLHGPLPLGDSLSYVYQIAHALAHAWRRGVVHRDIKPSNILVTPDGHAKLVDMGLARLGHVAGADDEMTATGVTLGTFDYISPEQARDSREADTRSDIYSLGCTLYFMLTGRPPFSSATAIQKLLMHQTDSPPQIRSIRPDVPDAVDRLLMRMLAKSVADRPQDPTELATLVWRAIRQANVDLPATLAPLPVATARPNTAWRRHAFWIAPLLLLMAATPAVDGLLRRDQGEVTFPPLNLSQPDAAGETPAASSEGEEAEVSEDAMSRGEGPRLVVPEGTVSEPFIESSDSPVWDPIDDTNPAVTDQIIESARPPSASAAPRIPLGGLGPNESSHPLPSDAEEDRVEVIPKRKRPGPPQPQAPIPARPKTPLEP